MPLPRSAAGAKVFSSPPRLRTRRRARQEEHGVSGTDNRRRDGNFRTSSILGQARQHTRGFDVRNRAAFPRIRGRHRRRCHGLLDPLSPRRGGRLRRHSPRAQPADLRHDMAFRRAGAGASLDPQPHRPHPVLRVPLLEAGRGDRAGDGLDQQGFALDRHDRGPARPYQAPGGAGASVRRARPVDIGGGGEGALAVDERGGRHRRRLVAR